MIEPYLDGYTLGFGLMIFGISSHLWETLLLTAKDGLVYSNPSYKIDPSNPAEIIKNCASIFSGLTVRKIQRTHFVSPTF